MADAPAAWKAVGALPESVLPCTRSGGSARSDAPEVLSLNLQVLLPGGSALAAVLPRSWAEQLADLAGDVAARLSNRSRMNLQYNMEQLLGRSAKPEMVRGAFRTYARYYLAMMRLAHRTPVQAVGPLSMHGRAHLQASLRRGRGALVLSAHFGNWDLVGISLARQFGRVCIFAEALRPRSLLRFYTRIRNRHGIHVAVVGSGSRTPIEVLRRNELLALAADRPFGVHRAPVGCGDGTLEVPTGGIRLALRCGAAIHTAVATRADGGFVVEVGPDLSQLDAYSDVAWRARQVAQRFATTLQRHVRRHPDQWCLLYPLLGAEEVATTRQGAA